MHVLRLLAVGLLLTSCGRPYWVGETTRQGVDVVTFVGWPPGATAASPIQQVAAWVSYPPMVVVVVGVHFATDICVLPVTGPHDLWVWFQHGSVSSIEAAYDAGDRDEAYKRLRRFLARYPDDVDGTALLRRVGAPRR